MTGEGLGYDQHGVGGEAAEDGWTDDVPELLGLDPNPCREGSIAIVFRL